MNRKKMPTITIILLVLWLGSCSGSCIIDVGNRMRWERNNSLTYRLNNRYETPKVVQVLLWIGIIYFFTLIPYLAKSKKMEEYTFDAHKNLRGYDSGIQEQSNKQNRHIPSHVRREVWRRDQGKCIN